MTRSEISLSQKGEHCDSTDMSPQDRQIQRQKQHSGYQAWGAA